MHCRTFAVMVLLVVPAAMAEEPVAPAPGSDADLIHMESRKWDPASLLDPFGLMAMFSSEMLSVDYGADLKGGAERRTWKEVLAYGPLPAWKVSLSDWRVLRPTPETAILSYKVTGVTVDWKGYSTSVWARQNGKWVTVFYQASSAK
jgi:hypothetical protein